MPIKLIALDMDGTLLGADHATIPTRNLNALRQAAAEGVQLAIASGRSWSLIRETAQALGPVRYGITANGAYTLDTVTGEAMAEFPMDRRQCADLIRILRKYDLSYELYFGPENYIQYSDLAGVQNFILSDQFQGVFMRNCTWVEDMLLPLETLPPEKFDIFFVPPALRAQVAAELEATGPLLNSAGFDTNMELTAAGVHKGRALEALARRLGLARDEVMAFGDASNDLEMLSWAGWSFAMGNATPAVKSAARFVTGTNDEGGVGMAVEKYVLGA